jgi:methyl-accepting chemotaxis protein
MNLQSIKSKLVLLFTSLFAFVVIGAVYFLSLLFENKKDIEKIASSNSQQSVKTGITSTASSSDSLKSKVSIHTGISKEGDHIALLIKSVEKRNTYLSAAMVALVCSMLVLLVAGIFWIVGALRKSLNKPQLLLDNLAIGDTSLSLQPTQDEFNVLIESTNKLQKNLKRLTAFAHSIGDGKFDIQFQPAGEKDELGNSLVLMHEKLKSVAESDRMRNWAAEGLALFADHIRKETARQALFDTLIRELVKYVHSVQGSLFVLTREVDSDQYLELKACYAYDRKKHLEKRIQIGEGIVGQTYLEGEAVYLAQVPDGYLSITSGLGEANPRRVLIVPLRLNDSIEGVIELASFQDFKPHEIDFVKRVAEVIASAIVNSLNAERTKNMLEESRQQSEEMRAQEEEMRQNMEEMQATQETMERQASELKQIQVNLELEKAMFHVLMDLLPDRITYKDTESRITRVNKAKAQRMNMSADDFLGKTDFDFFNKEHAEKTMRDEKAMLESGKAMMNVEERIVFSATNEVGYVSSSRIPFRNQQNKVVGMVIHTRDITQLKNAEFLASQKDLVIRKLLSELPVFHYKINPDKIVYEAWSNDSWPGLPKPSELISKLIKDIFPAVFEFLLNQEATTGDKTAVETFNNNSFKHYLFSDSINTGFYWVYAIKQ